METTSVRPIQGAVLCFRESRLASWPPAHASPWRYAWLFAPRGECRWGTIRQICHQNGSAVRGQGLRTVQAASGGGVEGVKWGALYMLLLGLIVISHERKSIPHRCISSTSPRDCWSGESGLILPKYSQCQIVSMCETLQRVLRRNNMSYQHERVLNHFRQALKCT